MEPTQKVIKIQRTRQEKSGIECKIPELTNNIEKATQTTLQTSGVLRFCPKSNKVIHFGDKITFFDTNKFEDYFGISPPNLEMAATPERILEGKKSMQTQNEEGPQSPIQSLKSTEIEYNDKLGKPERGHLEQMQMFHISLEKANPELGLSDLFLFWFGNRAMFASSDGSVNLYLDFEIEANQQNRIVASKRNF